MLYISMKRLESSFIGWTRANGDSVTMFCLRVTIASFDELNSHYTMGLNFLTDYVEVDAEVADLLTMKFYSCFSFWSTP